MPKRKSRDRGISQKAIAIAREAKAAPLGQSTQERLWVDQALKPILKAQSPKDRGQTWADGFLVNQQIGILYLALSKLSGFSVSHVIDEDVCLIVGEESFSANTSLEAVLKAIVHFLPQEVAIGGASDFSLEKQLAELDLLE